MHLKELADLFVQVVKLAREMGLVKLRMVAIDGTRIKANANRHQAMSYERMQQTDAKLKAKIDVLLERAKTTDAAEADEPDLDMPAEIERREVRLKAIVEARERLEQRQREADIERGPRADNERTPRAEAGFRSNGHQAANRRWQGGLPPTHVDRRATQRLDQERSQVPLRATESMAVGHGLGVVSKAGNTLCGWGGLGET